MPKTIDELILELTNTRDGYHNKARELGIEAEKASIALRATDDALQLVQALRDETTKNV